MKAEDLRCYRNWHEKTAEQILQAVIQVGGWAKVFPDSLPRWASRIRNYFNVTPRYLMRFDAGREAGYVNYYHTYRKGLARFALSDDVYKDENNRVWLQMHTASTVYHYPGEVNMRKKAKAAVLPQKLIPVFKLVSPDGTGGSCEVIIRNPKGLVLRDSTVVPVLHWRDISSRVVTDEKYTGSYNYSETIVSGLKAHELRDVKPHSFDAGFYLYPPDGTTLKQRGFPKRDRRGALIADQV
jgi:hypothetical protein